MRPGASQTQRPGDLLCGGFYLLCALSVYSTYAVPDRHALFNTSTLKIILKGNDHRAAVISYFIVGSLI